MRRIATRGWVAGLVVGAAALLPAASAQAQDADLLVRHWSRSVGADGITRTVEYSERVHRRASTLWVERVLPAGAHSHEAHAKGGAAHRHIDVSTAARWITREANGDVRLRLVPVDDKVLVDVAKTDYENVGFDGSWDAAWHLIDPAALKRLQRRSQVGELARYGAKDKGRQIDVVWNTRGQHPVSVASTSGLTQRRTTVQTIAAPKRAPWDHAQTLNKKDYSDYLD